MFPGFSPTRPNEVGGEDLRNESMHRMHNAKITIGIMRLRGNWGQFEGSVKNTIVDPGYRVLKHTATLNTTSDHPYQYLMVCIFIHCLY